MYREVVPQAASLLYRRLPVGRPSEVPDPGRLAIRDTADWQSAVPARTGSWARCSSRRHCGAGRSQGVLARCVLVRATTRPWRGSERDLQTCEPSSCLLLGEIRVLPFPPEATFGPRTRCGPMPEAAHSNDRRIGAIGGRVLFHLLPMLSSGISRAFKVISGVGCSCSCPPMGPGGVGSHSRVLEFENVNGPDRVFNHRLFIPDRHPRGFAA
jgi:hypothetical protein